MIGTQEGKKAVGSIIKTALPAMGIGSEEMGIITGILNKIL